MCLLDAKPFEVVKPSLDNFFKVAILPKLLCGTESCETPLAFNTSDKYCHCRGPEEGRMIAVTIVSVKFNGSTFIVLALLENLEAHGTAVKLASYKRIVNVHTRVYSM